MKIIARTLSMVAMLALAGVGAANAQYGTVVGQSLTCTQSTNQTGLGITIGMGGVDYTGTSSGTGTFQVTATTTTPSSTTYIPLAINVTSNITGLGTLVTSLGAGAPTSATTAINAVAPFPATSRMTFNATATGPGGNVYTSVGAVTLQGIVNTFNPLVNEQFSLQNQVAFVDAAGNPAFVLKRLDVVFN
jgi:hypothetical protein